VSDYDDADNFAGFAACADCGPVARQPLYGGWVRSAGFWRLAAIGDSIAEVAELLRVRVPDRETCARVAGDPPGPLAPPG
jgi:hypothetical protein